MSVSVLIATRDRPALLSEALESLRRQTDRQRIGQVIVSDGGSVVEAKETCSLFPDLPILYFDHRPPMRLDDRIRRMWDPVTQPVAAILHDDDWWDPGYLAAALRALERHPDCAAVMSSFYETPGPTYPAQVSIKGWRVWLASGCDFGAPVQVLDAVSVMLACLWESSFHYSTMVMRTEAGRQACFELVESANEFDTDRTFPVFLSSHGPIAYLTKPDVYTRVHPGQDCRRPAVYDAGWTIKTETTKWMLKKWPTLVAQAIQRFNEAVPKLNPADVLSLSEQIQEPLRTFLIEEFGMKLIPGEKPPETPPRAVHAGKWLFKQICPPAVLGVRRRVMERMGAWKSRASS